MESLRHTETNAADDSRGRAFGLDGNLYLPVLLVLFGALGLMSVLVLLLRVPLILAALLAGLPLLITVAWAVFLKQGKPSGHDRDLIEYWLGRGDFSRIQDEQRRVGE